METPTKVPGVEELDDFQSHPPSACCFFFGGGCFGLHYFLFSIWHRTSVFGRSVLMNGSLLAEVGMQKKRENYQENHFFSSFLILGEDFSGPVKAKLSDLLHSIFSFLNTYPAVTGDAIHLAIATLIANINGKRWSAFPLGNVTATAFCSVVEGHARVPPAGEVVVLEQEKSRGRISLNLVEKPTPESSRSGCCPLI